MKSFFTILILIIFSTTAFSQVDAVFWFAAPEITQNHADEPINLVVAATQGVAPTEVTISMPKQPAFPGVTITLPPWGTELIDLKTYKTLIEPSLANGGKENKGIKVS